MSRYCILGEKKKKTKEKKNSKKGSSNTLKANQNLNAVRLGPHSLLKTRD